MCRLGRATCTLHLISAQTSHKSIKCTKGKELTVLIYIYIVSRSFNDPLVKKKTNLRRKMICQAKMNSKWATIAKTLIVSSRFDTVQWNIFTKHNNYVLKVYSSALCVGIHSSSSICEFRHYHLEFKFLQFH